MFVANKHRWYDDYPDLRNSIEKLKDLNEQNKDEIIRSIQNRVLNYDNGLIDRLLTKFPFEYRRKQEGIDPYSWLVINSLRYVDEDVKNEITFYLKATL
jgi:hypothetical protein